MDFVSVALGIFSILQNFDKNRTSEEKLEAIKDFLLKIDDFYVLLNNAKDIHDTFEDFGHVYIEPLNASIRDLDNTPWGQVKTHVSAFLSYYDRHVIFPSLNKSSFSRESDFGDADIPSGVKLKLEKMSKIYPDLVEALERFEESVVELKKIKSAQRSGDVLVNTVTLIDNLSKEAQTKADKIILYTGELLGQFHHEIKIKIADL